MPTEQTATVTTPLATCYIPRDTANALHAEMLANVARFDAVPVRERRERQERVLRGEVRTYTRMEVAAAAGMFAREFPAF
jgi:hypothetical protein